MTIPQFIIIPFNTHIASSPHDDSYRYSADNKEELVAETRSCSFSSSCFPATQDEPSKSCPSSGSLSRWDTSCSASSASSSAAAAPAAKILRCTMRYPSRNGKEDVRPCCPKRSPSFRRQRVVSKPSQLMRAPAA